MFPLNYQFAWLSVFEKIRERHLTDGRTDRRTDGVQHLMRYTGEVRITSCSTTLTLFSIAIWPTSADFILNNGFIVSTVQIN